MTGVQIKTLKFKSTRNTLSAYMQHNGKTDPVTDINRDGMNRWTSFCFILSICFTHESLQHVGPLRFSHVLRIFRSHVELLTGHEEGISSLTRNQTPDLLELQRHGLWQSPSWNYFQHFGRLGSFSSLKVFKNVYPLFQKYVLQFP